MKHNHDQEKKQFIKLFKQEGIDRFEERFNVLEAFLQTEKHVTVGQLVQQLESSGIHLPSDFVRETLQLLCRFGFAQQNRFHDGKIRYEHHHLGQHHDHMICTKCRKIIEFENEVLERLQAEIALNHNFHMLQHRMEIYGLCSDCVIDQKASIALVSAKSGVQLVIEDISGGATAKMHLISMGLRIGDTVEVITSNQKGQLVIAVDCRRYVLGRGLASKIRGRLVEKEAFECPEPSRLQNQLEKRIHQENVLIPLSRVVQGQTAKIIRIGGNGALRRRILEMGMTKGTEVYVEKYAPLKDPVELIVKGYHISLRVQEAAEITVEVSVETPAASGDTP